MFLCTQLIKTSNYERLEAKGTQCLLLLPFRQLIGLETKVYINSYSLNSKLLFVQDFGLKLHYRDPNYFTPLADGRFLLLGSDDEQNNKEISKFSKPDAKARIDPPIIPDWDFGVGLQAACFCMSENTLQVTAKITSCNKPLLYLSYQ